MQKRDICLQQSNSNKLENIEDGNCMTGIYDFNVLKVKTVLADGNYTEAWKQICNSLHNTGRDFHTVSMHPRKNVPEKWFHAIAYGDLVMIQKAEDSRKNSEVTMFRPLRQAEFEILAPHYNDYVRGISTAIRQTKSQNSSYVITLIAELL